MLAYSLSVAWSAVKRVALKARTMVEWMADLWVLKSVDEMVASLEEKKVG